MTRKLFATAALLVACGGGGPPKPPVVQRELPEDQILRLGKVWQVTATEKGFLSPPSPVALFDVSVTDRLTLAKGASTAIEAFVFDEQFKMTDESVYECRTPADVSVSIRYGRRGGDAAIQVSRPGLRVLRQCNPPRFPEPVLTRPAGVSRFVLKNDQLVGVEPATEKRRFIPVE